MGVQSGDFFHSNKAVAHTSDVFPSSEDVGALVLDLGLLYVRAGNAGDDMPKQFCYSVAGKHVNPSLQEEEEEEKEDNGHSTTPDSSRPSNASWRFPVSLSRYQPNVEIEPCIFQPSKRHHTTDMTSWESISSPIEPLDLDKEAFEVMIAHIFGVDSGLNIDLKGKPLLFSDPNKHNRKLRESMAEILFETFSAEALYAAKKSVLTSFAVGRSSGLVIDIGKEFTTLAPVQEGYIIQNRVLELPISGDMMDYQLSYIMKAFGKKNVTPLYQVKKKVRRGPDLSFTVDSYKVLENLNATSSFHAYSEREALRQMKEAIAVVSEDPLHVSHFSSFMDNAKNPEFSLFSNKDTVAFPSQQRYTLPDGVIVNCEKLYGKIAECVLNFECILGRTNPLPQVFLGCMDLAQVISKCVMECDVDIRRDLLGAIILSGGSCMTPGFSDRVTRQLQESERLFGHGLKYKVVSPSSTLEMPFLTWIGGSILASLSSFQQMWISSSEYLDYGPCILERLCL